MNLGHTALQTEMESGKRESVWTEKLVKTRLPRCGASLFDREREKMRNRDRVDAGGFDLCRQEMSEKNDWMTATDWFNDTLAQMH